MTVPTGAHANAILRGARYADAVDFSDKLTRAWVDFNVAAFEREADLFDRLDAAVSALKKPDQYPAACNIEPLLVDARDLDVTLLSKLQRQAIGSERMVRIDRVRKFVAEVHATHETILVETFSYERQEGRLLADSVEKHRVAGAESGVLKRARAPFL